MSVEAQVCPDCGKKVTWDTENFPTAWRHDHESRWCEIPIDSDETEPNYPKGATNRNRKAAQWFPNPELWT